MSEFKLATLIVDKLRKDKREAERRRAEKLAQHPDKIARQEAARRGMLSFTIYMKPDYYVNWHHRILCDYLDKFVSREIENLAVFMPPRTGKSELISRKLPAYIFGINPDAEIIAASYGSDLAKRFNRDVQRVIDSPEYRELFPQTRLFGKNVRSDAGGSYLRNSDIFEIVGYKGVYRSAGIGGAIMGMGGQYILLDDTVKNRAEANSPTYRQNQWDWFASTAFTRRDKGAGILMTVTRWHMDDLAGRIMQLAQSGDIGEWVVLSFPAIAGDKLHRLDPRAPGEALWPSKFDLNELQKIRALGGEYEWAALYQQNPMPDGGGLFDAQLIEIVDYAPVCKKTARFYDLAVTVKKHSDYTVGLLLGVTSDEEFVILDVWRDQKTLPEVQEAIVQNARIDGPETPIRLEAEKAGIVQLDYLLRDERMRKYTIDAKAPEGDKYTRATPVASRVNGRKVKMVKAAWNRAFLDELSVFPMGDKDDQVDALSGAYDMLAGATKRLVIEDYSPIDFNSIWDGTANRKPYDDWDDDDIETIYG